MPKGIQVGLYDWDQFPVSGEYYPPDLPVEWKLSYFSNEFDSACLNLDVLLSRRELLLHWCEDLRESFQLSFSLKHTDQLNLLSALVQDAAISIQYLVVDASISSKLLHTKSLQPVLSAAGIHGSGQIIAATDLYLPDQPGEPHSAVGLFPASASMRQYRDWIDEWNRNEAAELNDRDKTFWLSGSSADYRLLNECRALVELMGF
jgi:hypothetical protein